MSCANSFKNELDLFNNPPAINTTGGSCLNYLFISTFIIDETSTPSASIIATLLDSCIDFLSTL